ncbi:plakophilin-4 [Nematolebias whitei]|uniref:plakophilin-4 n=1 Tax=Nematolebias whitei TaxID=451745 RepID=UPI0018991227|nr:plakophilin-4 [Nematolebias whitei]
MRRATFAQVCQWIRTAWSSVKTSSITNGFRMAGLLRDEEDSTSSSATLPRDESVVESDIEKETEDVCDDVYLRLFNSDTEEDDFSDFSAQEEDEDSASSRVLRRMASLPSRSQSPGCGTTGTVSPSRISMRTSQGSTYDSPILSEPKPLAAIFPGTSMPPSCLSPTSPSDTTQALGSLGGGGRLGSTLSLIEGRGLTGSLLRSGMTAVPQHYGSTLPRQSQSLAYGADPYGLYQRSALPRPDSLIGLHSSYAGHGVQIDPELRAALSPDCHMTPVFDEHSFQSPLFHSPTQDPQGSLYRTNTGMGTLPRTTSHCGTLPYQRSSFGVSSAAAFADSIRVSTEPVYSHRHSALVDRVITRTPSIESIHKDPREFAWRDPELPEVIHMLQHHFPSVQGNAAAYLQHLCFGDNRVKVEVCHLGGIQHLVDLLDHKVSEVQKSACGALRNLVYGKATDSNKVALRNCGGVPALLRLLRKTTDNEVRELVTGVLWNLSSCDAVKMTIIRDALSTLTNTVVIPHSGWSSVSQHDEHKVKFQSSLLLRNTTGCLRNLSSAGEEARSQLRCCEGLIDSLLHILRACVNTSDYDSKHAEPFYDEPDRKNYNSYRMYLSSPQGYGEDHFEDEPVHLIPSSPDGFVGQSLQFKANTNYVDFYSTTRRPSNRANNFTGSPDSWV